MSSCNDHPSCLNEALQNAEAICNEKGLRFTPLRRNVLEIIWKSHVPSKAYDILNKLNGTDEPAKPPTVYRTLDFLLEHGFIHRLNTINSYVGCSHPLKHKQCYFLICQTCEEVVECCNDELFEAIKHTASANKFSPLNVAIEVTGKCSECKTQIG